MLINVQEKKLIIRGLNFGLILIYDHCILVLFEFVFTLISLQTF
jgi:hypothetical protein